MIASGSADNSIRLWDTDTGICQKVLADHSNWVKSVAFSPDGQQLASASDDKTIRLWDVTTGQSLMTLTGHADEVQSVVYSPNGTQIASGSKDCTVRLWDVLTGACHHVLEGHSDSISCVAYSPRGERLASASDDTTVRLWDVETGHSLFALTGHTHKVTGIVFSPNGELLASGSEDRAVRLWNLALGTCMSPVESTQDSVQAVAWGGTPETSHLVAGCGNGSILMWQIDNEADLCRIQPYWSSTDGALTMTGASIQGVHGLSSLNKQLLEQRGAVGVPLLRDIGKLINLAVSKLRLPFYSYTEEVPQRDRRFTI
jgi:WD40 repeat protein